MAPLIVDPGALDGAGSSLIDVGKGIGLTLSTLTGTLSGCGSMCGNDPVGEAMGHAYDRSADALLKATATARNSVVNLGDGVRMSAFNYSVAEAQSDVSRRAQPLPAPSATGKITASSAPSSVGAGDSAPAGFEWVAKYIGMIWPNGDSAKLRAAAGAWVAAGTQLLVTETSAAAPLGVVGAQQIPEGEMMGQMFSGSLAAASQIMSATASVASTLNAYAGQIDATHAAIIDLLSRICDPMTGIKEIWDIITDEDEDEIKQIADDIKTVVDSLSAEASALASEISTTVGAVEHAVSGIASAADKEWDQFLHGTDVGGVINQLGQYASGAWGRGFDIAEETVTHAWDYSLPRMVLDTDGYLDDVKGQFEAVAPLVGLGGDGAPGVADVWKQLGKDTVHWDMWAENPAKAAGMTAVDLASMLIPGGAGGKVAKATEGLDNAAEHLPAVLPDAVPPPVRPPTPEMPGPRPGEPVPAPAPRPAEPSSLPPEAPRPTSPTESRPPAGPAPHDAPSATPATGEGVSASGGHVSEAAPVPASSPSPAGHGVPEAAPGAGAGAPKLPDLGGIASAAGSAGENLPKLPDLGGMASSAAGAGDDLVPAGVGAHSAEAAGEAATHGYGPTGGDGSGSGGSHGPGSDRPGHGGGEDGATGSGDSGARDRGGDSSGTGSPDGADPGRSQDGPGDHELNGDRSPFDPPPDGEFYPPGSLPSFPELRDLTKTDIDSAYYWSGRDASGVGVGPDGSGVAEQMATDAHATTLEMTLQKNGVDPLPVWNQLDPESVRFWEQASAAYADNASGSVTAVIGSSLRPGNIWETVEIGRLMENPNVVRIVQVDPDTGTQIVIFSRE